MLFAGYQVPHPLERRLVIKVQTTADTSPIEALMIAIDRVDKEMTDVRVKYDQEVRLAV